MRNIIRKIENISPLIFIVLLVCILGILIYYSNRGRLGLTTDSISYISTAENIKDGMGITAFGRSGESQVLSHFPPIVSLLISLPFKSAWGALFLLNFILYLLSGVLLFLLIRYSSHSNILSFIFTLFWGINNQTIRVFSMAWSEPLFIFLSISLFFLWLKYLKEKPFGLLILIAIISGLLPLVRYAGLFVFIFNIVLGIVIVPRRNITEKIQSILSFILMSLPYFAWSLYLSSTGNKLRVINISTMPFTKVLDLFKTIGNYILPINEIVTISALGFIALGIVLFGLFFIVGKGHISTRSIQVILFSKLYIVLYIFFLFLAMTLVDNTTPFDFRILSLAMPFFTLILALFTKEISKPYILAIVVFLLISIFLLNLNGIRKFHWGYFPYANPRYDSLQILNLLREKENLGCIVNEWEAVMVRSRRSCMRVQRFRDTDSGYFDSVEKYIKEREKTYLIYIKLEGNEKKYYDVSQYSNRFLVTSVYDSELETIYLIKLK